MMNNRLGLRAHDYGCFTNETEFALALSKYNTPCIQLAIQKSFQNGLKYRDLQIEDAQKIGDALKKHNIDITVLGAYINSVHEDSEIRKKELENFASALQQQKYFGAFVVGTETGKLEDPSVMTEEKRLEYFYDFLEQSLTIAQKENAIIAIEPVQGDHTINSFKKTEDMVKRFDCANFCLIYDAVNFLPTDGLKMSQEEYFEQFVSVFYKQIKVLHLKDFKYVNGNKEGLKPLFSGNFDIEAYLKVIKKYELTADILLENHKPETVRDTMIRVHNYMQK